MTRKGLGSWVQGRMNEGKYMSGEDLYELYMAANTARDVGVEAWDELDQKDQDIWNEMGEQVQFK